MRRLALTVSAVTLVLGLAACGDDDTDEVPTTEASTPVSTDDTTASTAGTTSTTPDSTDSSEVADGGCAAGGDGVPGGAESGEVIDVDGDGAADTAWITPGAGRLFGITTASGLTVSEPIVSGSPITASMVVADADEAGAIEVLVSDGRTVQLWSFADCALVRMTDLEGVPYDFSLGFTEFGTGVGCEDADEDGERDLVGYLAEADGDLTKVTTTLVELEGTHATNGESFESTGGNETQHVIDARRMSCGEEPIIQEATN